MRKILPLLIFALFVAAGIGFFVARHPTTTVVQNSKKSLTTVPTQSPPATSLRLLTPDAQEATAPANAAHTTLKQRIQSTYAPQPATKKTEGTPTPAVAQIMKSVSPPPNSGRPAAAVVADIETDDSKTAFPNPAISLHQAVVSETPDQDWSQRAAQQLADYMTETLGNRFEFPLVQCGEDVCEIQAVSFVTGDSSADTLDIQDAFHRMPQQSWWSVLGFDEQQAGLSSTKNGRVVFIGFITRL